MRRSERGAAAVEFALVLPLLVLLAFGIIEFGRLYYVQTTLSGAAREGARVMAITNDPIAARTAAKTAAGTLALTDSEVSFAFTSPATSCAPGATVPPQVTVTVTRTTTPLTGLFLSSYTVHGKGVMRCGG